MDVVYTKTPAGHQELKDRSRKLPTRLRFLLVMVDGSKSAQMLISALAPMGVTAESLQELESAGLIAAQDLPTPGTEKVEIPKPGRTLKRTFSSLGLSTEKFGEMLVAGLINPEDLPVSNDESKRSTNE